MKIKTRDKWMALILAAFLSLESAGTALAFVPWTNVNGYWISADGKTTIKGAVAKGVTITKYQNRAGTINWKQVVSDNVSFAMIRLGYYEDPDPYFDDNMKNAESVGLAAGVCFYGDAVTVEEARKEAKYVLDIVKDYRVSYPIAYDIESQYLLEQGLTKKEITEQVKAFCEVIEDAGFKAVVYGDYEWLTRYLDVKSLPYDIWYCRYGMANTFQNRTLWRCTDEGKINGIKGNVCLEFSFEDYSEVFPDSGWRTINGKKYYFENYKMVKNTVMELDGKTYFFDQDGNSRLTK